MALEAGVCPRRVGDVEQGAGGLLGWGILLGGLQRQQDRQIGVAVVRASSALAASSRLNSAARYHACCSAIGLRLGDGYLGLARSLLNSEVASASWRSALWLKANSDSPAPTRNTTSVATSSRSRLPRAARRQSTGAPA